MEFAAGVVGAVVGATIQVVLQNVLVKLSEINTGSGYNRELKQLNKSLVMVQKYLSDAEATHVRREAVQEWLKQLEDVAFEADAVLDEVNYELLRRQVKKQNQHSKKVKEIFSSRTSKWLFKRKMSGEIMNVINKLEKINKEAKGYGLPTAIAILGQTSSVGLLTANERETDSLSVEPFVVGRDNDVLEIVEKIITVPTEETISVIPIVGMGGVGKTTVARKVFHDAKIGNHFDDKIWVCVSFNFDSLLLLKMILGALTQELVNATREIVLQKIKQRLEGKRYLLVLDDVWNENYGHWDEFKNTLSNISSDNGNCIVVTTRNENVASQVRTLPNHQLGGLTESQCWSIIKAKTFVEVDIPEAFERIGKCIAERCCGLPLAAKVVGGLLRGKSEEEWCGILKNKLFDGDDDKIQKILKLSYDNLPSLALKRCFAYCSVFSQDYNITKHELIELWMAEGFLQVGMGDDLEMAGSKILDHLLRYSLFQDVNRDIFGDIVDCKMHDLVHELACSITKDMHQVRYLALESDYTNEPNAISRGQMKYLRTMFFKGKITNDMFLHFKHLHVLKLMGNEIKELPTVIEKLIHLRSLDISITQVEWLPDSIGKLYHLQTLSIAKQHLKFFPKTIINLVSLRHLHISAYSKLPPSVGKLTSLRTLQHYKVCDENGYRIGELGNLKNLKGELEIENLEIVKDKEEAVFADLYGKSGIFKLVLKWNESRDSVGHHENVLDGLQPHPHLKYLGIIGYKGKNLPLWTMRMAAQNNIDGSWETFNSLVEIKLNGCTQCEELPTLGHLQRLRFLVLEHLPAVRSIGISFYGLENCSTSNTAFPALERLGLLHMRELIEWGDVEGAATVFPCLKRLEIKVCPKLKNVHCHIPCLERFIVYIADFSLMNLFSNTSSLQNIDLLGLDSFPDELDVKNQYLTHFSIYGCSKLKCIGPRSLRGRASLKRLYISNCENLEELPNDLNTLCNLEGLRIYDCPKLKCISYDARGQSQGLTSLRGLEIKNCKWLTNLPIELLKSCSSSLETLYLSNLESLENLDTLIHCIWRMSHLKSLHLTRIHKLVIFPTEICSLGSLQSLTIGGFSESVNVVSFNNGLTSIKCPSLRTLRLFGKEHWDSLPDSVQNLTTLHRFHIVDFGIEDMPEWFGNLSSLQHLSITNCRRLRRLPSKEAMKGLTQLNIKECPLLKERCSPQSTHDSEWPKISHIGRVFVDGNL